MQINSALNYKFGDHLWNWETIFAVGAGWGGVMSPWACLQNALLVLRPYSFKDSFWPCKTWMEDMVYSMSCLRYGIVTIWKDYLNISHIHHYRRQKYMVDASLALARWQHWSHAWSVVHQWATLVVYLSGWLGIVGLIPSSTWCFTDGFLTQTFIFALNGKIKW